MLKPSLYEFRNTLAELLPRYWKSYLGKAANNLQAAALVNPNRIFSSELLP